MMSPMRSPKPSSLLLAALLLPPVAALGQEAEVPPIDEEPPASFAETSKIDWRATLYGQGQTDASLDEGSVEISRLFAGVRGTKRLSKDVVVNATLGYSWFNYNWKSDLKFGSDPWGSIHSFGAGFGVDWNVTDEWRVTAKGFFRFAGEEGADFGDALTGGGYVGASYAISEDLVLGGALGLSTRLEEDTRWFFIPIVYWGITDDVRLQSTYGVGAVNRYGMELVWDIMRDASIQLGGRAIYHRYRLQDDMIGEEDATQFYAAGTWRFAEKADLTFEAGVAWADVQLDDAGGHTLVQDDYGSEFYIGLGLRFDF